MRWLIAIPQFVVAVVAFALGVYWLFVPPVAGLGREPALLAGFVGSMFSFLLWCDRDTRGRKARVMSALTGRGFLVTEAGQRGAHQGPRRRSAGKLQFSARGVMDEQLIHVAEYYFSGLADIVPSATALEVSIAVPRGLPTFELATSMGVMGRPLTELLVKPPPVFGDVGFSERWIVTCDNHDAVAEVLTPDVRAWLTEAPSCEASWVLSQGWLSCTWEVDTTSELVREVAGRLRKLIELVGDRLSTEANTVAR